ncbi:MAG: sigma-70 family RNA polymerase sigma factor, partial [Anaerotignum sp.]|nr:sigma-70 family RNA polymerase sigma factor [Anaerotignum sp.]
RDGNEIVMLDVINNDTADFSDELDFSIQSQKMLSAIKECLNERERIVVNLRYGLGMNEPQTQQEIATLLGISRSYVSRIEKKALKKLRASLDA